MNSSQYLAWIEQSAAALSAAQDELTALDTAIGDGDHGLNIQRGFHKAVEKLHGQEGQDLGSLAKTTGMTLLSSVGGASGPLYGTFLMRVGGAWPKEESAAGLGAALRAGLEGIIQRGKAKVGDKTMVDALVPALRAYDAAAGDGIAAALMAAAKASAAGRDSTTALIARKGRASYLGERSAGVQDPGATSMTLLIEAAARTLA